MGFSKATSYTSNDGRTIISVKYPSPGAWLAEHRLLMTAHGRQEELTLAGIVKELNAEFYIENYLDGFLVKSIPNGTSSSVTITRQIRSAPIFGDKGAWETQESVVIPYTINQNAWTQPSVTDVTVTLRNTWGGLCIARESSIEAASAKSSTQLGATIKSTQYKLNGMEVTFPEKLDAAKTYQVTAVVTDSRGFTAEKTTDVTVYAYEAPRIGPYPGESSVFCERVDDNGNPYESGTRVRIKAQVKYSSLEGKNSCMMYYRIGSSNFKELTISDGNTVDKTLDETFAIDQVYYIEIVARDSRGNQYVLQRHIPTEKVFIELDGENNSIAFGMRSTEPGTVQVAQPCIFYNGVSFTINGRTYIPQEIDGTLVFKSIN